MSDESTRQRKGDKAIKMDRTIAVQNGKTIPIPKNVKKMQVQAIRKGESVMVTFKGVV